MKSKLLFAIGVSLVLFSSFSIKERPAVLDFESNETDTTLSILYLYGEHIYKRENCESCHTLKINEDKLKISLDGIAGKYSPSWHYYHLENPEAITYNSTMPSFSRLADQFALKDSIVKYLGEISEQGWKKLNIQSKDIQRQLAEERITVKPKAEIISLIYFISNLPTSDAYRELAKRETEKLAQELRENDSLWSNSNATIFAVVKDRSSISKGSKTYQRYCKACHGMQGEGGIGPNLTDKYWLNGSSDSALINVIVEGVPDHGMKSWKNDFTPTEVGQLIAFLKSLRGSNPENAKPRQGNKS